MQDKMILQELAKNKPNQKIGSEYYAVPLSSDDIKEGLSFKEIMKAMKQASKEKLFTVKDDVTFSR